MSQPQTTIIVVLMADWLTARPIDRLLHEIQAGLNQYVNANLPRIFCLYYRWLNSQAEFLTHQFEIEKNKLRFIGLQLDEQHYQQLVAPPLPGQIDDQLSNFMRWVRSAMPVSGPIRFIFGAHGFAALGIDPSRNLLLLNLMMQLLSHRSDVDLQGQIEQILNGLRFESVPTGFRSRVLASAEPDITLDEAGSELGLFPQHRKQTLVLHTCNLSSLETMSALSSVRHHIACETVLQGVMRINDWFPELANPYATDGEITQACFQSLLSVSDPTNNAEGFFSSHHTGEIGFILQHLDALGLWLNRFFASGPQSAKVDIIRIARDAAEISTLTVDIVRFCIALTHVCNTPESLTNPIIETVRRIQVALPVRKWQIKNSNYDEYRGINVYFPLPSVRGAEPTRVLPRSFRLAAQGWCDFVDAWLSA